MEKLSFIKNVKDYNFVDILFDETLLLKKSTEMITSYNIILANKLDDDILVERKKSDETNISKLNENNSTSRSRTIRKRKCNNKESVIPLVQKLLEINALAKTKKKT